MQKNIEEFEKIDPEKTERLISAVNNTLQTENNGTGIIVVSRERKTQAKNCE